mgnify:CR=1 FL=1
MSPLTPESWPQPTPPRSEVASLRAGVSLWVAWGSAVIVAIVGLVVALGDRDVGNVLIVVVAAALAGAGIVFRRRTMAPWLSLASIVLVIGMGIASPDTRTDTLVMGTYSVIYLAVIVTSRPAGLAWIGGGVLAMSLVVSRSDLVVTLGSVSVNVGMVAVVQLVVAGMWLWWAWHATLDQAARRDARAAEQELVIADSLAVQERTRAWRETIVRTHETILNDLRYVLRTPQIDRTRLREQLLTTRDRRAQPPRTDTALVSVSDSAGLRERLAGEFSGFLSLRDHTGNGAATLLGDVEPILVEVVRNIARHTDAQRVDITLDESAQALRLTVEDDGSSASDAGGAPGIGRSVVVGDAVAALGGRVDEEPHRCVITLPRDGVSFTGAGRTLPLLFGIVLIGSALGGSLQFLLLLSGASLTYLPVTLAAFGLTALGVLTVLRGRPVGIAVVLPAAVLATVVTWGMAAAQPVCAEPPLVLTTINLSLNAFFAILIWVRNRWMWLLVAPALIGVLGLDLLPGVGCPLQGVDVLLSSAILIPAALLLSWASARSVQRWEREDLQRWETEITEIARAEADQDLARVLGTSIDQAWMLMWEVAEGAPFDEARRRQLRTVESSIRSSLQADPRTSGGFVLSARHLVAAAAAEEVPLHVRALRGSADPRPLDADLLSSLIRAAVADPEASASIHVFFDGYDDYLTLTLPAVAAARAGFVPGWAQDVDGCTVEAEYIGEDRGTSAEVTIMVSRPSSVVEPNAAVVG